MSRINEISLRRGLAALVQNVPVMTALRPCQVKNPDLAFGGWDFPYPGCTSAPPPHVPGNNALSILNAKNLSPGVKGKMHVCGREQERLRVLAVV